MLPIDASLASFYLPEADFSPHSTVHQVLLLLSDPSAAIPKSRRVHQRSKRKQTIKIDFRQSPLLDEVIYNHSLGYQANRALAVNHHRLHLLSVSHLLV